MTQGFPRMLIVNPFGIGDVLFSTPLVRAIRRAFPSAYLAYLCNRRTQEILRRNPHLDELFIYEKDELVALWRRQKALAVRAVVNLLRQIRSRRFEVAVDLSLGERYSFILALLGVPRRIGFDFRHRGRFLTHRFVMEGYQDQHVVEYFVQLLDMIGIHLHDRAFELVPTEEDRQIAQQRLTAMQLGNGRALIGLVPAGGISWGLHAQFRRWSEEGFIRVGRALTERYGATLLVFGEPQDHAICAQIARAIGPSAINLSGQTTLGQFVSLVARCELVISNDGGPIHIAASQGVRTVSIFGPVDPVVYGPCESAANHRVVTKFLPCRPCYHQFKLPPCPYNRACLSELVVDDVLSAVSEVYAGTRAAASLSPP